MDKQPNSRTISRFLQEPCGGAIHRVSVGCLRDQLHPRQVSVCFPRLSHARHELRVIQYLANQAGATERIRQRSHRLRRETRKPSQRDLTISFSIVPERTIMRFFRLIGCDNSMIGTYTKLVDDRNESATPMETFSTANKPRSISRFARSCAS